MQAHPRMYIRNYSNCLVWGGEFVQGVAEFIAHAKTVPPFVTEGTIRCPCMKCACCRLLKPEHVRDHLYKKGFMNNYYERIFHGERDGVSNPPIVENNVENSRLHETDVEDFSSCHCEDCDRFDELWEHYNRPLHKRSWHSQMSVAVYLLYFRSKCNVPQEALDFIINLMNELNPNLDLPKEYGKVMEVVSIIGPPSPRIGRYDERVDFWASWDLQKKHAQAKAAQASEKGGSLHIRGSASTEAHRRTRDKKKGKNISYNEAFEDKHKKKGNVEQSHNEDELFEYYNSRLHKSSWHSKMSVSCFLLSCKFKWDIPDDHMNIIFQLISELNPNLDIPEDCHMARDVVSILGPLSPRSDGYDKGCDNWASKNSQKKNAQAKAAQASDKGGSLHIRGSGGVETHRRTLEKKKGKDITYDEVLEGKHKKKRKDGHEKHLVKPQAVWTHVKGTQDVNEWLQRQPAGEVGAAASSSLSRRNLNDEMEALQREIKKVNESMREAKKSRKRMARDIDRLEARVTQLYSIGRFVIPSYRPSDSSDEP